MTIPLSAPDITEAEIAAVVAVMRSTQLSLGPKLIEFEEAIARQVGVSHAVAVSSGTAGLHLAIRALNISDGDEVIVPSFTFIAAANAIRYERAVPVFVDIDAESLNLAPELIEPLITPKTKAILVPHTFGRCADMARIAETARRHRLAIIEDACEAIGAEYQGRQAGSLGHIAVFGFYPNKQITTGEGGVVVTRNAELADRIRALRNQGRRPSDDWLQHSEVGYNYRISEINCTLGIEQLKRLPQILDRREDTARLYHRYLKDTPGLMLPQIEAPGERISWFVYVVRLDHSYRAEDRDTIAAGLEQAGIATGRYFAPIHLQAAYSGWPLRRPLRQTEFQSCRTLALPFFNRISEPQIAEVSAVLIASLERLRRAERLANM